jgi:hypothetical protein
MNEPQLRNVLHSPSRPQPSLRLPTTDSLIERRVDSDALAVETKRLARRLTLFREHVKRCSFCSLDEPCPDVRPLAHRVAMALVFGIPCPS